MVEQKKFTTSLAIFAILIFSLFSLSGCLFKRSEPSSAEMAFLQGHYIEAYDRLEQKARLGDAKAAYAIGYMNYYGMGIAQDRDLARSWVRRSARMGYPPAQEALRIMTEDAYFPHGKPPSNLGIVADTGQGYIEEGYGAPIDNSTHGTIMRWMRSQPPRAYTIEIASSPKLQKIEKVKQQNANAGRMEYYRYRKNGEFWYALIMGSYRSLAQAEQAKQQLHPELQKVAKVEQWRAVQTVMLP